MLEVRGVYVILGGQAVVRGVDLDVAEGELLGLLGPNGAGKSTLLRAVLQLVPLAGGSIALQGRPVQDIPVSERARRIAYLAQQGTIHWPLAVERLVSLGRFPHLPAWQQLSPEDRDVVARTLRRTDLWHLRERAVTTLSGGERTLTLLARALAVDANLLLADEPVAALDPAHQLQIMQALRDYADAGHAVVVVLHDLTLAARHCHRLSLMHNGRLVASGTAKDVLNPHNLETVYNIEARYGPEDDFYVVPWRQKP